MPAPVPPVASGPSDPTTTPPPPEPQDTELGTAALLQISLLCVNLSRQVKDSAVDRVKKLALEELTKRGGIEMLLSMMAQQQNSAAEACRDTAAEKREQNRAQAMAEYQAASQEARAARKQNQQLINELNTKLYQKLLSSLGSTTPTTEPPNAQ